MNLKKIKILSVFGIFILCFITHFIYDLLPNSLFAIFFPVNESVWEHMKMIYTTTFLYSIIDYILLIKFKINHNHFFLATFISAIANIIIYLTIYLSIYHIIYNNMIIILIILLISTAISQLISYIVLNNYQKIKHDSIIGITLSVIGFSMLGYLTYFPFKIPLFFDSLEEKYGLNIYIV